MKENFINIELCKELKELGFNEPCFGYYYEGDFYLSDHKQGNLLKYEHSEKLVIQAPLWQQAFKWFRDKHKLIATPVYVGGDYKLYDIIVHDDLTGDEIPEDPFVCDTYEIAEEECLKFLIKIVVDRKNREAEIVGNL
jgi:hypothetical protein